MKKAKKIIGYAVLYAAFFIMSCYMVSRADDLVFKAGIERYGSFLGWVKWFSRNWGGRIVPQGTLVLLLQLPPIVFHFFDAFAWVVLLVYIKKIFDSEDKFTRGFIYVLAAVLIFVLIPGSVLNGTVFWKCANVLYLWGSTALLLGIYPVTQFMRDGKITICDYIFSVIGIVYASSFEQAGVLMCGVFFILIFCTLYDKRKLSWQIVALFLFAAACTFFFCKLPGNAVRSQDEVLGQMQNYDMYSTLDKILWGIWYVITNIEGEVMYLVLLLAGTVTFIMHKTRKTFDPILIGAYVMFGYFLLCTLNRIGMSDAGTGYFINDLFSLVTVDSLQFGFPLSLAVRSIIHFMAYVYLGTCILLVNPERFEPVGFTFYFGSLAAMFIMGFSPTIYASGSRPRFLGYLFLVCVEIRLLSCFADSMGNEWDIVREAVTKRLGESQKLSDKAKSNLKKAGIIAGCGALVLVIALTVNSLSNAVIKNGWTEVSSEHQGFSVPERWLYRYGTEKKGTTMVLDAGNYNGETSDFGVTDPAPNTVKTIYSLTIPDQYWIKVCDENSSFTAETKLLYRYGAEGQYFYKILDSGDYTAGNNLFDGDPAHNVPKEVDVISIPDKFWKKVSDENSDFSAKAGIYRYGADGKWNYAVLDSGKYSAVNGSVFGDDPAPNTKKAVYQLRIKTK